MNKSNVFEFTNPDKFQDALTDFMRNGIQEMLYKAVEIELAELMETYAERRLPDGRAAVVRNGHHPERDLQTGIGPTGPASTI